MVKIDKRKLLSFIAKAHKNTYAAPKEIKRKYKCKKPILPGHKDYNFQEGDWEYHDSYAGSIWAPGKEVIFFKGKPVWAMSYQGRHNEEFSEEFFQNKVFPFLQRALMQTPNNIPFRGPVEFTEEDFEYSFNIIGNWQYFTGREKILYKGLEIFFQDVMGELIK